MARGKTNAKITRLGRTQNGIKLLLATLLALGAVPRGLAQNATASGAAAAPASAAGLAPAGAAPAGAAAPAYKPKWSPIVWVPPERVKSYNSSTAPQLRALANASALAHASPAAAPIAEVPPSFLGLSFDLNDVEGVAHKDYVGMINHLTAYDTGPMILRVGAYSADRLIRPWPATIFRSLSALHNATRTRYLLGVNLHAESATLTQDQIRRAQKMLPRGAVLAFAVGNEPDMYSLPAKEGLPGSVLPKHSTWLSDTWVPLSKAIYAAAANVTTERRMLAGPDWSDSGMDPKKLQWWLGSVRDQLSMVTVHHYGGEVFKDTNVTTLLQEARMTSKMPNLAALVKTAKANGGLPLRVSESATLSYGGVQGISDTAGAALWALDLALEVAAVGVAGIHYHQVLARDNNANYNAIDYHAITNRVRARHPVWGYIMLQQALDGGADIVGRGISGECKVWLLRGRQSGELRILLMNKADDRECAADVRLTADQMREYASEGQAHYMYASAGLSDRWRIYYSGAYFDLWGSQMKEKEALVPVKRYADPGSGGAGGFAIQLTNGTIAALVVVPTANATLNGTNATAASNATAAPTTVISEETLKQLPAAAVESLVAKSPVTQQGADGSASKDAAALQGVEKPPADAPDPPAAAPKRRLPKPVAAPAAGAGAEPAAAAPEAPARRPLPAPAAAPAAGEARPRSMMGDAEAGGARRTSGSSRRGSGSQRARSGDSSGFASALESSRNQWWYGR